MAEQLRILGISGSLRKGSYNSGALKAADELCPEEAQIDVFDIAAIPPFNQDDDQDPPAVVREIKEKIIASDAVLFSTPEYNYSIPGVLKNAIDWASRPYGQSAGDGTPAAIMGASIGGIATARAQYDLRKMMVFLNMFPINRPEVMIGNCAAKFDESGNLADEATRFIIKEMLENLIAWTRKLK